MLLSKRKTTKMFSSTTYTKICCWFFATARCVQEEVRNKWPDWGIAAILGSFASNTTHPVKKERVLKQKKMVSKLSTDRSTFVKQRNFSPWQPVRANSVCGCAPFPKLSCKELGPMQSKVKIDAKSKVTTTILIEHRNPTTLQKQWQRSTQKDDNIYIEKKTHLSCSKASIKCWNISYFASSTFFNISVLYSSTECCES